MQTAPLGLGQQVVPPSLQPVVPPPLQQVVAPALQQVVPPSLASLPTQSGVVLPTGAVALVRLLPCSLSLHLLTWSCAATPAFNGLLHH